MAAAAYRAGQRLMDERSGKTHTYSAKQGIASVCTLSPPDAPDWSTNLQRLWNAAEAGEKRVNSCVARELLISLPCELDGEERQALARDVGRFLVDRYSTAVTVAVHLPDKHGDQRNHHAHLLFPTRELTAAGFGKKLRVLDDRSTGPQEVEAMREAVARLTNERLTKAGAAAQVDHRPLSVQAHEAADRGDSKAVLALVRVPTYHEGRATRAARRRGSIVGVASENDELHALNRQLRAYGERRSRQLADLLAPLPKTWEARPTVKPGRVPTVARRQFVHRNPLRHPNPGAFNTANAVSNPRFHDEEVHRLMIQNLKQATREAHELAATYLRVRNRQQANAAQLLAYKFLEDHFSAEVFQRVVDARNEYIEVCRQQRSKWKAYGSEIVKTVTAKNEVEAAESNEPSRWRPLTRRQWAQRRRDARVQIDEQVRAEDVARRTVGTPGQEAEERRLARRKWWLAERERRARYPIVSEWVPNLPPAEVTVVSAPPPEKRGGVRGTRTTQPKQQRMRPR